MLQHEEKSAAVSSDDVARIADFIQEHELPGISREEAEAQARAMLERAESYRDPAPEAPRTTH